MGDEEILQLLPGKFKVSNTLIVGLRSWDEGIKERQKNLGIKGLSPEEVAKDSSSILKWLKGTGASKVVTRHTASLYPDVRLSRQWLYHPDI